MRKLEQDKAVIESENQALKRQNQYFQELFARQNLAATNQISETTSAISSEKVTTIEANISTKSQKESLSHNIEEPEISDT